MNEQAEYVLGAKVLPRVGAFVSVVMFVYPIGIGQWIRNEREEYGQILTGLALPACSLSSQAWTATQVETLAPKS